MEEQKVWKKEEIKSLLETYQNAVEKGIKTLFKLQTRDEQSTDNTRHNNGVGFSAVDAHILSSYAKQLNEGRRLTNRQLEKARTKMLKYAVQLTKVANKEIGVE